MKLLFTTLAALTMVSLSACQSNPEIASAETRNVSAPDGKPWTVLFDGTSLSNWDQIGAAEWDVANGMVTGSSNGGAGYLVSRESYGNFELEVEFWVDDAANSGVFLRCQDPTRVNPDNAYEVNIDDTQLDQEYRTGAIVGVFPPMVSLDTADKWNTYEITADGSHLVVLLNRLKTVDTMDGRFEMGPIALQASSGVVKFRSVKIRPQ